MNKNFKRLYQLTDEEFIQLQQSGTFYKLFPEFTDIINVNQFKQMKEDYEHSVLATKAAIDVILDIVSLTGADPEDIWTLVEENKERIEVYINNLEFIDAEEVLEALYNRGE
jgi:hypothetical protein